MKKRKLVLVTTNTSQVSSAAKEGLVERPEQIDWSLYPDLSSQIKTREKNDRQDSR